MVRKKGTKKNEKPADISLGHTCGFGTDITPCTFTSPHDNIIVDHIRRDHKYGGPLKCVNNKYTTP